MSDDATGQRERVTIDAADLARLGSENAESAFSLLADRSVEMGAVVVTTPASGDTTTSIAEHWECGVFFQLEGSVDSFVALMFQASQRDALIEQMMGEPAKILGELAAESVMTEVANIVASHVASGIADAVGGRLVPSLPSLVATDAAAQFEVFLTDSAAESAPRYGCELGDDADEIGALLVFVPATPR